MHGDPAESGLWKLVHGDHREDGSNLSAVVCEPKPGEKLGSGLQHTDSERRHLRLVGLPLLEKGEGVLGPPHPPAVDIRRAEAHLRGPLEGSARADGV